MRAIGRKPEMSNRDFQEFLGTMITEGCLDVRVLTQAMLAKFGGEQGLADMIYENYITADGTAKATYFGMIMKLIQMGIDKDKERDPLDDLSQDQLHKTITKFLKVSSTDDAGPGLEPDVVETSAAFRPPANEPEDGAETSVSFEELVDSVHETIGLGDRTLQPSALRERLPFLYGKEEDNQGEQPGGEDS